MLNQKFMEFIKIMILTRQCRIKLFQGKKKKTAYLRRFYQKQFLKVIKNCRVIFMVEMMGIEPMYAN